MTNFKFHSPTQEIEHPLLQRRGVKLYFKRDDLIHTEISGNKWRKLKFNIRAAQHAKKETILTFGGAYSNHIAATAAAGKMFGIKTIGVIRGEPQSILNPTLSHAVKNGMHLHYIDREDYRKKEEREVVDRLLKKYGEFYLIEEGGSNFLGVKGCEEIVTEIDVRFDIICCACGTGTTLAGIINSLSKDTRAIGFSVLKGEDTITNSVEQYTDASKRSQWEINTEYHFGGYAKYHKELVEFILQMKNETGVMLDPVYTGKMMYGVLDMIKQHQFAAGTRIIMIHTGGLQGIEGYNKRYGTNL